MGQTGRGGNARALRWTFPSFLALFTVDARGGAADRSGKESRERNKLSRSIDCSLLLSVPFPSLAFTDALIYPIHRYKLGMTSVLATRVRTTSST